MPCPNSHVYDPLPSANSIRVMLLAPGNPEDDIFCYLHPCDLDKDHAIDPSVPRPFKSTDVLTAEKHEDGDSGRRLLLEMDSYIDERQEVAMQSSKMQSTPVAQREATSVQNKEQPRGKQGLTDDEWHLSQLAKLTIANGNLYNRVKRHPFQRYTALSYVWGSVEDPAHITIDGHARFEVTRNLFNALKSLRRPDVALSLWVDAICINQGDSNEKRVQIGLMRRVYSQAQKVIAYVPQEPEDADRFSELLSKILRAYAQFREVIDSGAEYKHQATVADRSDTHEAQHEQEQQQMRQVPLQPTGTCIEDYDMPLEDDAIWLVWRRFFASPYFRRIWILQEFTLAKDLHFDNGSYQFAYTHVLIAMRAIDTASRMLNARYLGRGGNVELARAALLGWRGLQMMNMERISAIPELYDQVTNEQLKRTRRLIDKIGKAFDYDATDPRDRIYALLGLTSDAEYFQALVSYHEADTYEVVYRRFAVALIHQGHLLQILHMACKTPSSPQMPSWVPDWTASTMSSMTPGVPLKKGFRAGGILQTGNRFEQEHNQLILIGQVFSKIAFMTSPAQKYSLNAALGGRIQDIFEMLMIALNELAKYLKQNPTETLNSFFYCVTMQTGSLKSIKRDDPESRDLANDFVLFRTLFARIMEYDKIESHAQHKVTFSAFPEDDFAFIRRVGFYLGGRCFCVTSDNQIGLVPERAQVGDSVAIVEGAPVPFVLREASESVVENEKAYRIVGDAYVHGVMRGELVGLTKKKESGLRRLFGSSKKKIEFEWSKMLLL